jgi:hypothetical protein
MTISSLARVTDLVSGRQGPKMTEVELTKLTLGYHGSCRVFTNWSFADGVLADGVLANWRVLNNRLRARHVRSNRGSYQG